MQLLGKYFDIAFAAPDGIKKLRQLVLTLAMKGKLVPQDSKDQPISKLLKDGEWENQRLFKEGKLKASKPLTGMKSENESYDLPNGWDIISLGDAATLITKGSTPTTYGYAFQDSGIPFVKVENVKYGSIQFTDKMQFISDDTHEFQKRSQLESKDILFSIAGTIGETCVVKESDLPANINQALAIIRGYGRLFLPSFLIKALNSVVADKIKSRARGAAMNNISLGDIREMLIPLPPLAEQHRIVAKIDQLMARCDELEKLRAEREQKQLAVHAAALNLLFTAAESNDFSTAWRFITQHFGELYSVKENVAELRKAILRLAVMGKLTSATGAKDVILADIIELISGQHLLASEYNEEGKGIPYLTGPSDFGTKYPTPSRWTETPKVIAEPGDILITVKGAGVGKTNKLIAEKTAISRQLMAVRVSKADPDFVHLVLKNASAHFQSTMTGIAIPGIGRKDVLNLKVRLPPLAEQHRIVTKIDQLMDLCDAMEQQIDAATSKQSALLNALMAQV